MIHPKVETIALSRLILARASRGQFKSAVLKRRTDTVGSKSSNVGASTIPVLDTDKLDIRIQAKFQDPWMQATRLNVAISVPGNIMPRARIKRLENPQINDSFANWLHGQTHSS